MVLVHVAESFEVKGENRVPYATDRYVDATTILVCSKVDSFYRSNGAELTGPRDLFLSSQRELPETLRTTFERIIQPNLISIVRDCQVPLSATMSDNYRRLESTMKDMLDSNRAEHEKHISLEFAKLYQQQLNDLKNMQQNSISSLIASSNVGVLQSITSLGQSSHLEQSFSLVQSSSHNGGALHTNLTPSTTSKTSMETTERLSLQEM
jgi:hypothetical protein